MCIRDSPEAPSIVAVGDRSSIVGGEAIITFEFADPNDGQTFSAAIDWGDGTMFTNLDSVGRSFTASHIYDVAGEYTPTVWVTDATLRTDRANFLMTVHPALVADPVIDAEAPVIDPIGERSAVVGGEASLTVTFTDATPGDSHAAAIDWGDGSPFTNFDSVGRSFTATHRYEVAGAYTPTVWVTDSTLRTDRQEFLMVIHPAPVAASAAEVVAANVASAFASESDWWLDDEE